MTPWLESVAEHLSKLARVPWRVELPGPGETRDGACYLRRERIDGGRLFVAPPTGYTERGKKETHLQFSADWPRHPANGGLLVPWDKERSNYARLHRTVAVTTAPLTAAKAVHRHVLVPFEAWHSEAWGQLQRVTRDVREQQDTLEELRALGADVFRGARGGGQANIGNLSIYVEEGGIQVRSCGSIDRALVLDIARLIAAR